MMATVASFVLLSSTEKSRPAAKVTPRVRKKFDETFWSITYSELPPAPLRLHPADGNTVATDEKEWLRCEIASACVGTRPAPYPLLPRHTRRTSRSESA